jgi:hypothetical protein
LLAFPIVPFPKLRTIDQGDLNFIKDCEPAAQAEKAEKRGFGSGSN